MFLKYHATHSTNEKPIQQNIHQSHNKCVQENNYMILYFKNILKQF
jgi:hypothetical protein